MDEKLTTWVENSSVSHQYSSSDYLNGLLQRISSMKPWTWWQWNRHFAWSTKCLFPLKACSSDSLCQKRMMPVLLQRKFQNFKFWIFDIGESIHIRDAKSHTQSKYRTQSDFYSPMWSCCNAMIDHALSIPHSDPKLTTPNPARHWAINLASNCNNACFHWFEIQIKILKFYLKHWNNNSRCRRSVAGLTSHLTKQPNFALSWVCSFINDQSTRE